MKAFKFILACLLFAPLGITQTLNLSESSPYTAARIGLNMGYNDYYEDYLLSNWTAGLNPSFQPPIYSQTISVAKTGTTSTFTGINPYDQVAANWWANGGTFNVVYGSNAGCTGTITANTTANQSSTGVTYTISPACSHAFAEYDVVNIYFPPVATSTADINAGNLGWNVSVTGGATVTSDTTSGDLPPAVDGFQPFQVLKVAAPSTETASLTENFDTTSGILYYNATGTITDSLKISVVSGSPTVTFAIAREASGGFSNSQVVTPSGGWNTYSTTFSVSESTSQAAGEIQMSYTVTGGTVLIVSPSVTSSADNTNGTAFRTQVKNDFTAMNVGEVRFWEQQNGETMLNWITPQGYRSPAVGTGGDDYATVIDNATFQTGLHDDLVFAHSEGISAVWITVPLTFSTADVANLIQYMDGSTGTTYGALRASLGQTTPWNQVFQRIVYEYGNEVWNGAAQNQNIPYGGGGSTGWSYIPMAVTWCAAAKAETGWNSSVEKCAATFQTGSAYYASQLEAYDTDHEVDVQSNNEYGGYTMTTVTSPDPQVSASVEAWGAANGCAQSNQYCVTFAQAPQTGQYEWQHGDLASGTAFNQTTVAGFGEGEGYAAMVDAIAPLWVGQKWGALDHDFFTYSQPNFDGPSNLTENIWGIKTGAGGAYNNPRPAYYAMQVDDNCIGTTGMAWPVSGTSIPTFDFSAMNGVPAESNVPYLQAFEFKPTSSSRCVLVANVNPSASEMFSVSGTNAPSGTVTVTTLTAAALTTNNEGANGTLNVQPSTTTVSNPSSFTLAAHSIEAISWTPSGSLPVNAPIGFGANIQLGPNLQIQ